ncbi:E3 ubiquitin-protein ligase Topors-like protein [Willisornis vidua]|uniref:RING-type E3 ubiquitin transferase n=1 Tax=Willisornis vidua TaxID=1566151 RepID=A0ABQ9DQ73_9PASS|nr:E3 ubiquitin-protein ligase Topors-like protein [Willisornis vidua]
MASGKKWSCPICCDASDDLAHVMPCGHQFCLGCILRWAEKNPACPLCRRPILTVKFSDRGGDDYLHCVITPPTESPATNNQGGETSGGGWAENNSRGSPVSPASSPQEIRVPTEEEAAGPEAVGGILPEVWAELFRRRQNLLAPVRPWLCQGLEMIYGGKWWQVKSAESGILLALCVYGPNREVLIQRLEPRLQQYTVPLIHGILNIIETQCSEEVQRLRHSRAAIEEDEISAATSSSTATQDGTSTLSQAPSSGIADSSMEEEAGTLDATLQGHASHPSPVSIPAEQGETTAATSPSAWNSSQSPSTPDQGRDHSPMTSRRLRKRRTPCSPDGGTHSRKRPRNDQQ